MDRARTEFMEFREAYREFRSPARTIRACRANGLTRPSFACVALAPVSVWFFRMVFTCAREATKQGCWAAGAKERSWANIGGNQGTCYDFTPPCYD